MRYASLEERSRFYNREFDLEKVAQWLKMRKGNTKFAVIIGRHTRIFPKEYEEDVDTTIIIDEYRNLTEVRRQIVDFCPESAYYDRNIYDVDDQKTGQELAFDLDPENITCPIHGSLADKMRRGQGFSFCRLELEMVKEQVPALRDYLEQEFSTLRIVYSGRGFHIHVFYEESYGLSGKQRLELARKVKKKGFAIDEWVTAGEMRLIRLPYSLNGLVSRIVFPLEKSELDQFDPLRDERVIPNFQLKKSTSS